MRPKKRKSRAALGHRKNAPLRKVPSIGFPIAGVGASAGGLDALERLLKTLPANTGIAFVLVQHLDPKHESRLTEILSHATSMPVAEAKEGMRVQPNRVYIIPPNKAMSISGCVLHLEPRRNSKASYFPVDFFFRSLAADRRHETIGVILSGTASDGAAGMRAIKAEGGVTFAQDPGSARFPGMPQNAIAAGVVDFVLSPEEIGHRLGNIGNHPYFTVPEKERETTVPSGPERTLAQLLQLLKKSFGVDFSNYKSSTVNRRIHRRMALRGIESLEEYFDYSRGNPDELQALFQDMFIGVTEFFRDPGLFKALERSVFPAIMKRRAEDDPIRIWVPGCSTGEEVYSISISLMEYLGDRAATTPIQLFGTDANEEAIRRARLGQFGNEIASGVGQERLRRYFVKDSKGYQISKMIRDRCVFAKHDITRDAPFHNLDLLSCRNLLIYLSSAAHQRLIPLLHYTLRSSGFLVLGSAETVGGFGDLFSLKDRRYKIYAKKASASRPYFEFPHEHLAEVAPASQALPLPVAPTGDLELHRAAADQLLLNHHGPPAVLVNENLEILLFRGRTSPYLEPAQGAASLNLLRMAREGLLAGLEKAVKSAQRRGLPARQEGLHVNYDGQERVVDMNVLPIKTPATKERTFLIIFEDGKNTVEAAGEVRSGRGRAKAQRTKDDRAARLQQELAGTKAYLQSVIENQEAANEELRSLNEEIQSSNEELQSTTEELETANEELQSANEELHTLNEELQHRSAELAKTNTQLQEELIARQQAEERFRAMVESAPDAMVIADADGKIALVNRKAEDLFGYQRGDVVGRPIESLLPERFRKQHISHRTSYMKNPQARPMGIELDLWGLRKDGGEFPIEVSLSPLPTKEGGVLISSIIRDVTQRKALAERVKQTLRLEERNRMARDVHDTLAQGLTAIVLQLDTAEEECKHGPREALRRIARAREMARSTLEEARRSVISLSSLPSQTRGLANSIHELVDRIREETAVRLQFSLAGTPRGLDTAIEENLVRITQQAITNALQHAQASEIRVELGFNKANVQVRVTDNGRGFVDSAAEAGFGLRSMRERTKELGGKLNLKTQPGKGTRIEVQIPTSQSTSRQA